MTFFTDVERDLVVASRTEIAAGVVAFDLVSHNGRDLPVWSPGSHLDVVVPGAMGADGARLERQYSLCGDPADRAAWRIAVLREDAGSGASRLLHDTVAVGDRLRVRGPRNHFPFAVDAGRAVRFVAGGIGITPILGMMRAAEESGAQWHLHYAGRSRDTMAFVDELVARWPDRVTVHAADEQRRLDVDAFAAGLPAEASVYVCGPARLIDAVEAACPSGSVQVERFEAVAFGDPVWREPFEVELAISGTAVTVEPGVSVLSAIEQQSPETVVLSSCRRGTCGTCEVPVLEGDVEHRDSVLTPLEREDGLVMMACVSRAAGPRIVLDL